MKKIGLILAFCSITAITAHTQKLYTKSGKISFFSSAPLENISAVNRSAVALLDPVTGELQFSVLMKGFEFKKALMQEHFNKNFVESDKYPRAEFKGQLSNNSLVNYSQDGSYKVNAKGKLTIHGVTRDVVIPGTITVKNGKITAGSVFNVLLSDYKVTVPKMYIDNISKSIRVTVETSLEPVK